MEFRINKHSELPIYQQLKEQIRYFLLNGSLEPGTKIPPPKDLGAYLQINKNTVIAAYKELEQEGYLVTRQGQGTYVADNLPALPGPDRRRQLLALAGEALTKTKALGFSPEDFYTVILNQTILESENPAGSSPKKSGGLQALFVECNLPDLRSYQETLRHELGIKIDGCLLDELPERLDTPAVTQADFVITVFSHLEDVQAIIEPLGKDVIAVMAAPQFQVLMQISQLPPRTRVGLVCVNEAGAFKMKSTMEAAGIRHLHLEPCSLENLPHLKSALARVDQIICSRAALDDLTPLLPHPEKVMKFFAEIDRAGLDMLKNYIAHFKH